MTFRDRIDGGREISSRRLLEAMRKRNKNVRLGVSREWKFLPTGLAQLDNHIIGIGGLPCGGIVEIAGPSGSAKSALLYTIIANVQKNGGRVAILQPEDAYDSDWGRKIGVIEEQLFTGDFSTTEEAFRLIMEYVRMGIDLVAIDSVARLIPEEDFEQVLDKNKKRKPGAQAKTLRFWLGALMNGYKDYPRLKDAGTCLVLINHTTHAIGGYGRQYVTTGGTAVEFDPHLRLSTWPRGYSNEVDDVGVPLKLLVRIKLEKSQLQWRPRAYCDVWLTGGGSFEDADDGEFLLSMAIRQGVVERRGGWICFTSNSGKMGLDSSGKLNGKRAFKEFCDRNPDFKRRLLTVDKKNVGGQFGGGL